VAGPALKTALHQAAELVQTTLLRSNWAQKCEGVTGLRTKFDFPQESAGMTGRVITEIDVTYSSLWTPNLDDSTLPNFGSVGVRPTTSPTAPHTPGGATIIVPTP
jgi:hypothetical protein